MPRKSSAKPRVAIIGAGSVAGALAEALHNAGYVIDEVVSRDRTASLRRARRLAAEVRASAVAAAQAQIGAEIAWFCVPDGAIAEAAESLSAATNWKGKVALHSSGALNSDALAELRRRGAAVASVHPLMTFVRRSRPPLAGVPFAIEGDQRAVKAARSTVADLGGKPFSIRKEDKEAYHVWGMFVSPLFTALLAVSEQAAAAAGIRRGEAKKRMLPILRQTLANYAVMGAPSSFSGPIARGDMNTIRMHLAVLRALPEAKEVYLALAQAALSDLPTKNRATLERLLKPKRVSRG